MSTAVSAVLSVFHLPDGRVCHVWCPGCEERHAFSIAGEHGEHPEGPCWEWDGNAERPTFNPSLLVNGVQWAANEPFHRWQHPVTAGSPTVCHSFIQAGQWKFLTDCTHRLAGQTVPMVALPDLHREA